jgi:hypothetical protein
MHLFSLLLCTSSQVAAPAVAEAGKDAKEGKTPAASVPAVTEATELTSVLATVSTKFTGVNGLPPALPTPYKRWRPELAPDAPHDPHAYFPMILVK